MMIVAMAIPGANMPRLGSNAIPKNIMDMTTMTETAPIISIAVLLEMFGNPEEWCVIQTIPVMIGKTCRLPSVNVSIKIFRMTRKSASAAWISSVSVSCVAAVSGPMAPSVELLMEWNGGVLDR